MIIECYHETIDDHSFMELGVRHWTCSICKSHKPWSDSHQYFGSMECKHCKRCEVDRVTCSDECNVNDREDKP